MGEDFDSFWCAYPRRQAKADALKAWRQTESLRPPLDVLLTILAQHCQQENWHKDGGAYIPLAASWCRGLRWEDELKVKLAPIPRKLDKYDLANIEYDRIHGKAKA